MRVTSRFAVQAVVDEPSASDQRVKLFKELSRLEGSGLAKGRVREVVLRRRPESGAQDPGHGVPKE
jgi:hypothetical protein